VALSAVVLPGR
jgi:hypothetical protein